MTFEFIIASPWTEERVTRLKELWDMHWSAAKIADDLATTRNSILGKVHRLGLETHKATPRIKKDAYLRIRLNTPGRKSARVAAIVTQPIHVPQCEPITFMELKDHSCCYPVTDDAPWTFCGADTHGEHSYCGFHYRIAYMPSRRPLDRAAQETRNRRMAKMRRGRHEQALDAPLCR